MVVRKREEGTAKSHAQFFTDGRSRFFPTFDINIASVSFNIPFAYLTKHI